MAKAVWSSFFLFFGVVNLDLSVPKCIVLGTIVLKCRSLFPKRVILGTVVLECSVSFPKGPVLGTVLLKCRIPFPKVPKLLKTAGESSVIIICTNQMETLSFNELMQVK